MSKPMPMKNKPSRQKTFQKQSYSVISARNQEKRKIVKAMRKVHAPRLENAMAVFEAAQA